MHDVKLVWRTFDELDAPTLYALLALRQSILVVEQRSPYVDLDGRDREARHLVAVSPDGAFVGYARLFGPHDCGGTGRASTSFGRVAVLEALRKHGVGRALIAECLRVLDAEHPRHPVRISAQTYLERLYASFGFSRDSEPYADCGVMHVDMLRTPRGP